MKRIFKICLIIFLISIFTSTISYAGYSFSEVEFDIDKLKIERRNQTVINLNLIPKLLGFNIIYTPYIMILVYLIIQFCFIKKYQKIKPLMIINIIILLLISITNNIISEFVIDGQSEVVYITLTMYITNNLIDIEIINIAINTLILIIGLIYQKRILKKYTEEKMQKFYKIAIVTILISIIILISILVFANSFPKMHVVETDWGFGEIFDKRTYDRKVIKGRNIQNTQYKVLEIDDEGVLIEYTRGYYEKKDNQEDEYDYKKETVQQKMLWDVNYSYKSTKNPSPMDLCVDGGTNYYVRFEK